LTLGARAMSKLLFKATAILAALTALPVAAEDIDLRFIHYQSGNQPALRAILDEFEAANPGITVTDLPTTGAQTVVSEIQAAAAAGRPFDVGQVLARTALGVIEIANARPFSEAPDGGAFMDQIAPNLVDVANIGEERYMMPHSFGTPLLYLNTDLMEQAGYEKDFQPETMQETIELTRAVLNETGFPGLYWIEGGLDYGHQAFMRANGSPYLVDGRAAFNTPEGIEVMQMWQDLANEGVIPKIGGSDAGAAFNAGRLGAMVTSSASLRASMRAADGRFELAVYPFPAFEGKPVEVPNSGSGLMVLAQEPERIEAAFKLMAFMAQPEVTNRWSRESGYMPVAVDPMVDADTQAYLAENPFYAAVVAQMSNTVPTVLWPGDRVVEAQTVMANLLQDLWANEGTAEELVPIAQDKVNAILEEATN
ncbi:MAG: extracellular solute-binding protein, partial [Pseudomonadota bacterium]